MHATRLCLLALCTSLRQGIASSRHPVTPDTPAGMTGKDSPAGHLAASTQAARQHELDLGGSQGEVPPTAPDQVFEDLDADHDGKVTHAEIIARLRKIRTIEEQEGGELAPHQAPDANQEAAHKKTAEKDFVKLDTDKSGTLSWGELRKHISSDPPPPPKLGPDEMEADEDRIDREESARRQEIILAVEKQRFDASDDDNSGELSGEEFLSFETTVRVEVDAAMEEKMLHEDVRTQIWHSDGDGNGELTFEEFEHRHDMFAGMTHPEHLRSHVDL